MKLRLDKQNKAISYLDVEKGKPIIVIGNERIRQTFDDTCLQQALNAYNSPGVEDICILSDSHAGYGAPIGCVMTSKDYVYPGPVGFDIKCSMSLLQFDIPKEEVESKEVRRKLINAIESRVPFGEGKSLTDVKLKPSFSDYSFQAVVEGASNDVCLNYGIPLQWTDCCEDYKHGNKDQLLHRLNYLLSEKLIKSSKLKQLGSIGGGNHFIELDIVNINKSMMSEANIFGLQNNNLAIMSHFGSRGFGHNLAQIHFKGLEKKFNKWKIPFPGGDKELVYAPVDSPEGQAYIQDMYLGANFATVNHLIVNKLLVDAVKSVFPAAQETFIYYISHNMAREEVINGRKTWVFRKGTTRAFPAGHFELKGTMYENTGHPILLPGNCVDGSRIMVAKAGAKLTNYSINHGAGRALGRKQAKRELDQAEIDRQMDSADVISNHRNYPLDESKPAYKDFNEVIKSVEQAGLATTVASLKPIGVLKGG